MGKLYEHCYWTSPDGLELHYRDYAGPPDSDKVPVICLHGLTRNARDFAPLAAQIAKSRRVIVPEMRGRGMSEYAKDAATYTPQIYVEDVKALLLRENIGRAVSIGTSMGGLMTMMLAAQNPSLFAGALINDIGPDINPVGLDRIGNYVGQGGSFPTWMHAARALKAVHSSAFPDYGIDQWLEMAKRTMIVGQNSRISFDYDLALAEPFKQPGNAAPPDLWSDFDALKTVPMVLVRGELSDLLSEATAQEMMKRAEQMTLVTAARIGHAPMLNEPECLDAISQLLERV